MAATLKKLPAKKATVSAAELLAGFQKDMGESVGSFGGSLANSDRIPTGLFPLDLALGGGFPRGRCSIIYGPESSNKCHAAGTKILMSDGTFKNVETIKAGDQVMGVDSTPRTVLQAGTGYGKLYRITPVKGGDSFVVNADHVLSLVCTHDQGNRRRGDVVNISLSDYLTRSKDWKVYHHLYRVPVDFPEKELPLDPYWLGLWLGDGASRVAAITTPDPEIVRFLQAHADQNGWRLTKYASEGGCPSYATVGERGASRNGRPIVPFDWLERLDLLENKHVPQSYKTGSREQRLRLLAGLLDSDGHRGTGGSMGFVNTNRRLCEDVLFVARSLGLYASMRPQETTCNGKKFPSFHVYLSGDFSGVPLLLDRKRPLPWRRAGSPLTSRFTVEELHEDVFYGFVLDGDHLYLLDSFIVNHNTNIVLRAIASHQMLWPDKINVFFDIENSFDPDWAAQLGVQTDKLIVIKPGYAEQCVDMAESFLYSEDCGIVAIDSLAALVTTGELEASAEKGAFGGASMVTGKLARKTTLALQEAEKQGRYPSLFYVNQTRFKMGVMFGDPECVHADTMIPLTDGRSFSMRELCENKIEGSVWGYDPVTDTFAPQPIISHHFNGQAKDGDFVTIITNGHDIKNGFMGGTFSFTHKFLTPNGWTTAGELKAGDQLISKYVSTLNPTLAAFLDGVFVGDSTLTIQKQASIAGFRLNDKNDPDYLAWKVALLKEHLKVTQSTACTRIAESVDIYRRYAGGVKRHPSTVLENFEPLSLAVWFMDYGYMDPRGRYTLCIGRARHDSDMRQYVCDMFVSRGFNCVWSKNGKNLVFSQIASEGIAQLIAPFVPPCMHRKVPDSLRTPGLQSLGEPLRSIRTTLVTVISAEPASKRKYRQRGLFDIHVGGRNTYLAGNPDNGFVVHNTMPGGNAPRFQASMWLRVYGKNVMDKSVSDVMPVIKEVNFVLKKWKCPVLAASGKFEMATQAYGGLQIGQCDDFGTVSEYLKTFGEFEKADKGKGWTICGEHYDTIQPFKTRLYEDAAFGAKIRHKIITTMLNQGVLEGDE